MTWITDREIAEWSNRDLIGREVSVKREYSQSKYTLQNLLKTTAPGRKSVVWLIKDEFGDDYVLKIIPEREYQAHAMIDELTEVRKLNSDLFARIVTFGTPSVTDVSLEGSYISQVIEYVDGFQFSDFTSTHPMSVDIFVSLARQLFTAVAILRQANLCHDDLHPGNVLFYQMRDPLSDDIELRIKIIDTGSIKRISTRRSHIQSLIARIQILKDTSPNHPELPDLEQRLAWKQPDDHLRVVECLLFSANALAQNYYRSSFEDRRFIDKLQVFFDRLIDSSRRLDDPRAVTDQLNVIVLESRTPVSNPSQPLQSPFDYISAEMIRSDQVFSELFSRECPWLTDCENLEPLYIYGPRGSGKSSVLRWLSFKTISQDSHRNDFSSLREIGIYVSCSVELRSRFWLLSDDQMDRLEIQTIRYFSLLLLEELFDTLALMWRLETSGQFSFGLRGNEAAFTLWAVRRIASSPEHQPRVQGENHFAYLGSFVKTRRWDTWSSIQKARIEPGIPDPALVSDICRELGGYFQYFKERHITFLIDDYSNQRIPVHLQRKLNQTISFAKQGTPIFKVSSEYKGVDTDGIQEGREVVEINIGERYTSLNDGNLGVIFLADILNIRLRKCGFDTKIETILGQSSYDEGRMASAIAAETSTNPFYYHGINCIHWLCSGDLALALDLVRQIFTKARISPTSTAPVAEHMQHQVIQKFSHDEVDRIRYIVPHGEKMLDIVYYLGVIARAFVIGKRSERKDKKGNPVCKNHLDIRPPAIEGLDHSDGGLKEIYNLLTSRAILFSILTSRSRIEGTTERLQIRRIYLPAFKAPLQRDVPIKIDSVEDLKSLLQNPRTFAERELRKARLALPLLDSAIADAVIKPRE